MTRLTIIILLSIISLSCGKDKPKNHDAYLNVNYYDKFDNEIDSVSLLFNLGNSQKVINHFFEYKNDADALNECNKQMQRITNIEYFKAVYYGARLYYYQHEPEKSHDFNKISKIGFQCQVKSKNINEECKSKLTKKFLNHELLGRKDPDSFSKEEATEVLSETKNKLDFFIETGSCNYLTLGDLKIYILDDLLRVARK